MAEHLKADGEALTLKPAVETLASRVRLGGKALSVAPAYFVHVVDGQELILSLTATHTSTTVVV